MLCLFIPALPHRTPVITWLLISRYQLSTKKNDREGFVSPLPCPALSHSVGSVKTKENAECWLVPLVRFRSSYGSQLQVIPSQYKSGQNHTRQIILKQLNKHLGKQFAQLMKYKNYVVNPNCMIAHQIEHFYYYLIL